MVMIVMVIITCILMATNMAMVITSFHQKDRPEPELQCLT